MEDLEKRVYTLENIETRTDEGKNQIVGYAAVYRSMSQDLGGFTELVEPGFFRDVLNDDVRSLFNHDPNIVLGRTKAGTLRLEDTPRGLKIINDLPDTTWGRDLMTSIRRGDIDQMSFSFRVKDKGDSWERNGRAVVRTLRSGGCKQLVDVSPVTMPAYQETSVAARSLEQAHTLLSQADKQEDESSADQAARAARKRQLAALEKFEEV